MRDIGISQTRKSCLSCSAHSSPKHLMSCIVTETLFSPLTSPSTNLIFTITTSESNMAEASSNKGSPGDDKKKNSSDSEDDPSLLDKITQLLSRKLSLSD